MYEAIQSPNVSPQSGSAENPVGGQRLQAPAGWPWHAVDTRVTNTEFGGWSHVKKVIARGGAVVGAAAVSAAVLGSGVATADSLTGKTYADARTQIGAWSSTPVIATVFGTRLPMDECIVTHWQKDSNDKSRFLLSLNCNAGLASATEVGNSAASPEGRAAREEKNMEYWRSSTPEGQAWCSESMKSHPEWEAFGLFQGCP